MSSCLVHASKPFRIALILVLTSILSAWTCTAISNFSSCPTIVPSPQIFSLLPNTISGNVASVPLTVNGTGFVSQSQILWNGNRLQTTFMDSRHLQTTITQQTFSSFGGSSETSVSISVMTPASTTVVGCNDSFSGILFLDIN